MRESEKEEVKELMKGCSITSRKTGSCKMDLGSGRHLTQAFKQALQGIKSSTLL